MRRLLSLLFALLAPVSGASAAEAVPVTPDNFVRAETDLYFGNSVAEGGFGKFHFFREPMPVDHQTVIRANRDTLYGSAVFDLDAGPVTITLPDAAGRFLSMQVFDQHAGVESVRGGLSQCVQQ